MVAGRLTCCRVCHAVLRSCVLPAYCYRCDPRGRGLAREMDPSAPPFPQEGYRPPITSKRVMYEMLGRGDFGNTLVQYAGVAEWVADGGPSLPWWGVRTKTPGGPCRLNCPAQEVAATAASFAPHQINISVMISSVGQVTFLGELYDAPGGAVLTGREWPPQVHDWRPEMRTPTTWTGAAVPLMLRRHLNPSSHEDLAALREAYPGHVYEFSCMDVCYGTVPGRNTIMWEVRPSHGLYEAPGWGSLLYRREVR